ncbi:MAG: ADYC domain-containing protein [Stellaceae bacterium]
MRWGLATLLCLATLGGCSLSIGMDRGPAPGSVAGNSNLTNVAGHFESGGLGLGSGKVVGQTIESGGVALRIDAMRPDPNDPAGDIVLYRFTRLDGARASYCPGDGWGFPMAGSWSAAGAHLRAPGQIAIACVGTAEARCVALGYRPWRHAANGADLWDYHQACVRALRADYCGTGHDRAANGRVVLYDRLAIHPLREADGMSFEAAWSAQGAACVSHVRAPSRMTLRDLRTECANLPRAHLGNSCDEREPALIFTKSPLR